MKNKRSIRVAKKEREAPAPRGTPGEPVGPTYVQMAEENTGGDGRKEKKENTKNKGIIWNAVKGRRVLPWRNSRASGTNDRVREKKRKIKTMKKRRRRSKEKKRKHTDCNEGGRGTRNERDDRRARRTNVRAGIVQDHSQTSHLIKGTHYKRGRKKRGRDMLEEVTSVHYPLASLSSVSFPSSLPLTTSYPEKEYIQERPT